MSEMTAEAALAQAAERHAAQLAEYSRYVATQPIMFNGVLAFRAGEPVPVGHVEPDRFGLLANGQVRLREAEPAAGEETQAVGVSPEPPGAVAVSGPAPAPAPATTKTGGKG